MIFLNIFFDDGDMIVELFQILFSIWRKSIIYVITNIAILALYIQIVKLTHRYVCLRRSKALLYVNFLVLMHVLS